MFLVTNQKAYVQSKVMMLVEEQIDADDVEMSDNGAALFYKDNENGEQCVLVMAPGTWMRIERVEKAVSPLVGV